MVAGAILAEIIFSYPGTWFDRPKEPYTQRLLNDVPKIYEEWDLSTV